MPRYLPKFCDFCNINICYAQWRRHERTKKHKYNSRKILC